MHLARAGVRLAGMIIVAAAHGAAPTSNTQPAPTRIHDCPACPVMIVIPGGDFLVGSPESEPGRHANEGPQRKFRIKTLAVSETEITRKQFRAYLQATGRQPAMGCDTHGDGKDGNWDFIPTASWTNPGFLQGDNHPVVCVSWQDAHDYADWIASRTGQPYRLLTEAEWEYSARAGSTSAFYWGAEEDAACRYANGGDRSLVRHLPAWSTAISTAQREGEPGARLLECDDGAGFTNTVGRLLPNAFGLKDMSGNVWEWIGDCYVGGSYDRHTTEGGLPNTATCEQHRARGGSWDDYPIDLRSARRTAALPLPARRNDTGFRVARDLPAL